MKVNFLRKMLLPLAAAAFMIRGGGDSVSWNHKHPRKQL